MSKLEMDMSDMLWKCYRRVIWVICFIFFAMKMHDERKDPGFTTDPLLSFVESCIEMALALSGCIHRIGRWENFNRKPHQIGPELILMSLRHHQTYQLRLRFGVSASAGASDIFWQLFYINDWLVVSNMFYFPY